MSAHGKTDHYRPGQSPYQVAGAGIAMRARRLPNLAPAIHGIAKDLPLDDQSVDASMALVIVHQWANLRKGLSELRRVTRNPVLILTFDREALDRYWMAHYVPELIAYFNPNYDVLARLVEVASGQTFSAYLESHIFTPLGMKNTFNVLRSDETEKKSSHLAQGHVLAFGIPIPADEMIGYLGGSGGVISTVEDLANFLIMENQEGWFADKAIVSPESITLMQTPPSGVETNYGIGWFVRQEHGQKILEHNGIHSVFYAEVVLLPEEQIGIAMLYNASPLAATTFGFPETKMA